MASFDEQGQARSGTETSGSPVGARFPRQRRARDAPADAPGPSATFSVVRRGYDRDEVDDRLRALAAELTALRAELGTARQHLDEARSEIRRLHETAQPRAQPPREAEAATATRGPVAEKIIRSAQREALFIRATAQRDAARLVEDARSRAVQERDEPARPFPVRHEDLRWQPPDVPVRFEARPDGPASADRDGTDTDPWRS